MQLSDCSYRYDDLIISWNSGLEDSSQLEEDNRWVYLSDKSPSFTGY